MVEHGSIFGFYEVTCRRWIYAAHVSYQSLLALKHDLPVNDSAG